MLAPLLPSSFTLDIHFSFVLLCNRFFHRLLKFSISTIVFYSIFLFFIFHLPFPCYLFASACICERTYILRTMCIKCYLYLLLILLFVLLLLLLLLFSYSFMLYQRIVTALGEIWYAQNIRNFSVCAGTSCLNKYKAIKMFKKSN